MAIRFTCLRFPGKRQGLPLSPACFKDPGFTRDENTLIIQCEEGETEYEPDMLKKTHSVVECIEDEDEYNGDTLRAFVRKHHPDRVIIEMNGMWDLDAGDRAHAQSAGNLSDHHDGERRDV